MQSLQCSRLCAFSLFVLSFHQQMAAVGPGFGLQIVVYMPSVNTKRRMYDNLSVMILHCENYKDLQMCFTYKKMLLFMSKYLNAFHQTTVP